MKINFVLLDVLLNGTLFRFDLSSPASSNNPGGEDDDAPMGETQQMLIGALNTVFATRRATQGRTPSATPGLQTRQAAAQAALQLKESPSSGDKGDCLLVASVFLYFSSS